ncbi:MAG: hypothetical protein ACI9JM_000455 [Halioglobus sp.]|jgi:hypothetical protein
MMELLKEWQPVLLWVSGVSLLMAIATLICIPWVITQLPQDYFARTERVVLRSSAAHPGLALLMGVLKNMAGFVLLLMGIIMLVTPGQGIMTMLVGLLLMNFPGKYRFERWLVLRPGVLLAMNWVRGLRGRAAFDAPPDDRVDEGDEGDERK